MPKREKPRSFIRSFLSKKKEVGNHCRFEKTRSDVLINSSDAIWFLAAATNQVPSLSFNYWTWWGVLKYLFVSFILVFWNRSKKKNWWWGVFSSASETIGKEIWALKIPSFSWKEKNPSFFWPEQIEKEEESLCSDTKLMQTVKGFGLKCRNKLGMMSQETLTRRNEPKRENTIYDGSFITLPSCFTITGLTLHAEESQWKQESEETTPES